MPSLKIKEVGWTNESQGYPAYVHVQRAEIDRINKLLNIFERFVVLVAANEGHCYEDWIGDWSDEERTILAEIGAD